MTGGVEGRRGPYVLSSPERRPRVSDKGACDVRSQRPRGALKETEDWTKFRVSWRDAESPGKVLFPCYYGETGFGDISSLVLRR